MLDRRGGATEEGPAQKYLGPKNRRLPLFTVGSFPEAFDMGEDEKLFTDGEAYERRMCRWSRRGKDAVAAAEYDVKALAAGQKTVRSKTLPHGKITMIQPPSQPATTIPADDPEIKGS
jgi:hypothetical protein